MFRGSSLSVRALESGNYRSILNRNMAKVIGIDLGTTNSVVAVMENGVAKVVPNKEGNNTTPSVVAFTETETLTGQRAKNQAVTNPTKTVSSIKRIMGLRVKDTAPYRDKLSYAVSGKPEDPAKISIEDKNYLPQEISAKVLLDLKKTAEDYLGHPVTEAVITVPAYFNDSQRQATKDAGRIAGLEVKRIINEPTAAALAYGLKENGQNSMIVVFDLGGGTLDISVLEIGGGVIEVKSTHGDTFLGGDDFDILIQELLLDHLKEKHQVSEIRKDPVAMQRLREVAELAKKDLSSSLIANINLPFVALDSTGTPIHLQLELTRTKFEDLLKPYLTKMERCCKSALSEAGLSPDRVDQVVLVGGSTRIPAVQHLLKKLFGKEPNKTVNPDEVVAQGAAIQAAILSGEEKSADIVLLDVTPLSLGIETEGGDMDVLIPKNTPIPCSVRDIYSTAEDDQEAVDIYVYQGEHTKAVRNRLLAKFELDEIEPAEMGEPNIEVSFNIDTNGILHVTAKDLDTGKVQHVSVNNSFTLSEEDLQKMQADAKDEAERALRAAEAKEKLATAKALIQQTEQGLKEFENKLKDEEKSALVETRDILSKAVEEQDLETVEEGITAILFMWEELSKQF